MDSKQWQKLLHENILVEGKSQDFPSEDIKKIQKPLKYNKYILM